MDWNWVQVGYQVAASTAIAAWSFFVTLILLFIINKIPYLHLRQSEIDEGLGGDFAEMDEVAYMLVISEPEAEPLDDKNSPYPLGIRADGMRISTADGLSHMQGSRKDIDSAGSEMPRSPGKRRPEYDAEMLSFSISKQPVTGTTLAHGHGVVNRGADMS